MTITIGENIAGTIDEIDRNRFELGFRHLCTAIDQSAKKHYKTDRSGRKNYQQFITSVPTFHNESAVNN